MGIRAKLMTMLCLLGIAPVWAFAWGSHTQQKALLEARALRHLEAVATVQRERVHLLLRLHEDQARLIASRTQMRRSLAAAVPAEDDPERQRIRRIVGDAMESGRSVVAIVVFDREGRVVAQVARDASAVPRAASHLDSMLRIVGEPGATPRVEVQLPLHYEERRVGTVAVAFDGEDLVATTSDYTGLFESGETFVAIGTKQGDALFVTPTRFDRDAAFRRSIPADRLDKPIIQALAGREATFSEGFIDYREKPVLAVSRFIAEYGVGIVVKIDAAEALAPVSQLAMIAGAIALLLSLGVFALSDRLARQFVAPVLRIRASADALQAGRLERLPEDGRNDEFGALFRAFNQMSETLLSERKRLTGILEGAPVAMMAVDRGGRIVMLNAQVERLFGLDRERLLGLEVDTLLPALSSQAWSAPDDAVGAPPGRRGDLFVKRADTTKIAVEIGIRSAQIGREFLTLISVVDLSERKRIEDELRRSNAELERFASVASHDLQEPLRKILLYADYLFEDAGDQLASEAESHLHVVLDNVAEMQGLVESLLEYSRIGSIALARENFPLSEVADKARRKLAARIEQAGARVVSDPLPSVTGDRWQLAQLFRNLIENALEFAGPDGREIALTAEETPQGWILGVRDRGVGFDPGHAQRVLEPFKTLQAKREQAGTGIGLAVCARIVDRHGGRLWIETSPGHGVHVRFTLAEFGPTA